jgi:hypothetical protein
MRTADRYGRCAPPKDQLMSPVWITEDHVVKRVSRLLRSRGRQQHPEEGDCHLPSSTNFASTDEVCDWLTSVGSSCISDARNDSNSCWKTGDVVEVNPCPTQSVKQAVRSRCTDACNIHRTRHPTTRVFVGPTSTVSDSGQSELDGLARGLCATPAQGGANQPQSASERPI